MFEVTVLGTASAMPTVARSLPSIAVRNDGEVFLLDCGEGTQRQMMRFGISYMKVKAIFISHLHLDHFLGAFGMFETMGLNGRTEKLTLYGLVGSKATFGRKDFLEIVEIAKDGPLADFGEFTVSAFPVQHIPNSFGFVFEEKGRVRFYEDKAKAAGLKGKMFSEIAEKGSLKVEGKLVKLKDITYFQGGKKLVYTGDTVPLPSIAKIAKGADLLIHDSTFASDKKTEAKETHHSTAEDAARTAKKAAVKRLLLTHFSGRYADASLLLSEARAIFPDASLASDGMKLEV